MEELLVKFDKWNDVIDRKEMNIKPDEKKEIVNDEGVASHLDQRYMNDGIERVGTT